MLPCFAQRQVDAAGSGKGYPRTVAFKAPAASGAGAVPPAVPAPGVTA